MPLGEIGAFLLVLIGVFLLGKIWFHFVESILDRVKRLLFPSKKPVWHPLVQDKTEQEHQD